jgi:hypothetical protein
VSVETKDATRDVRAMPSRGRRHLRIFVWQIAIAAVGIALVEIGLRVALRVSGDTYNRAELRGEVGRLMSTNQDFVPRPERDPTAGTKSSPGVEQSLHPYLGWEIADGYRMLDDEYRWMRSPQSAGVFTILLLGGSVCDIFDNEEYGVGPLRRLLKADPRLAERELHFLRFGRGGFKEPQQVNYLVLLLSLGFRLDVVIDIDGFNEVALGNNNFSEGSHPVYPSASHWAQLATWGANDRAALDMVAEIRATQHAIDRWCALFFDWKLERSCLAGTLVHRRILALIAELRREFHAYSEHLSAQPSPTTRLGLEGGEAAAVEASVKDWMECSRTASDICRARGILYLQFLQPTLHDAGSKTPTKTELEKGGLVDTWRRGVELGYPMMRQRGEELKKLGVNFIDLSMIFKDRTDDIYFDACHFAGEGNQIMAEHIAQELLRRLPPSEQHH